MFRSAALASSSTPAAMQDAGTFTGMFARCGSPSGPLPRKASRNFANAAVLELGQDGHLAGAEFALALVGGRIAGPGRVMRSSSRATCPLIVPIVGRTRVSLAV